MIVRGTARLTFVTLLFSMICVCLSDSVLGQGVAVLETNFEKGTQKWESRGSSVSIKSTKEQAANGEKSLRVKGRREFWQGTQLNVTNILSGGKNYQFTVSVKLAKGEDPDAVKLMMQRGDKQWEYLAGIEASQDRWLTMSGRFRPDGSDRYLLVYLEAARERTTFYIDDFKIEELKPPKQIGTLLKSDFQDQTAQNWSVRGENVQMFSAVLGESRSLRVGRRTEPWHGLVLDLSKLLYKGRTYKISVSAKLVEGESPDSLQVKMFQSSPDGNNKLVEISPLTQVTDSQWARLSGEYEATTEGQNLFVTVEAKGAKTAYYIDDFELSIQ